MASPEQPAESHSPDLVRVYLNDIGKTPLLKAEEEVELAKDIEAGLYAEHLLANDENFDMNRPPKNQRMRDLGEIALRGDEAMDEMVQANLRLVVSLAKRYSGRGMPLLDLIQEGNLGLIRAVEKFDYTKGFKFSTYATWWIRQSITRAMPEQGRTMSLPIHFAEKVNKLHRMKRELALQLGREATMEELAEEYGASIDKVEELITLSREPISLDMKVGDEEEAPLSDFIQDDAGSNPTEDEGIARLRHEDLHTALNTLDERTKAIISMRFGLDGRKPMTLDQIGEVYGLSRERVRQIEKTVMTQLRTGEHGERLRPYVE